MYFPMDAVHSENIKFCEAVVLHLLPKAQYNSLSLSRLCHPIIFFLHMDMVRICNDFMMGPVVSIESRMFPVF